MRTFTSVNALLIFCFLVFLNPGCSIIKKECAAPPGPCDIAYFQTHCRQSLDDIGWLQEQYFENQYCFCQDLRTTAIIVSDQCLREAENAVNKNEQKDHLITAGNLILFYVQEKCDLLGPIVYQRLLETGLKKEAIRFADECHLSEYEFQTEQNHD